MKKIFRRTDIDLLRAVAVLSVILFHFDVPGLQGGFLGVDVFFVISGYLITSHLKQQITNKSFTFTSFYGRRVKRLMPALLFTLIVTGIAAAFIMPGKLLANFSESLVATSIYVSNIYFYSQTGYFDTASHLKPLLHTWSLSVEEQFYLVWPLIILGAIRFNKLRVIIFSLFALSLIVAELMFVPGKSFTFFMFPFRAFEFAIGAALFGLSLSHLNSVTRTILSVFGWVLVFGSIALLDEQSRMPGLLSLPVCLGTALIILLGKNYTKLPMQKLWLRIGVTSYSSYLLHWPLVVFYKILFGSALIWVDIVVLLIVTFLGAEFMFRYIENRKWLSEIVSIKLTPFFWPFAVTVFALLFFVISPIVQKNLYDNTVSQLLSATPTHKETKNKLEHLITEFSHRSDEQTILVVGDSHSKNFAMAFGPHVNQRIIVQNNICDPLSAESLKGVDLQQHYRNHTNDAIKSKDCTEFHKTFIERIQVLSPDFVIFSERWQPNALKYLGSTIESIKNKVTPKVLLMGPNLELVNHPLVAFKGLTDKEDINRVAKGKLLDLSYIETAVAQIAKDQKVYFISKAELVCPGSQCKFFNDDMLYYTDTNHWSEAGLSDIGKTVTFTDIFKTFLDGGQIQEESYSSWYMHHELDLDVHQFKGVPEFFRHVTKSQRFETGKEKLLVIGDTAAVEITSSLFLANYQYSYNIVTVVNACPPNIFTTSSEISSKIQIHKNKSALECQEYTSRLSKMLSESSYQHLIIAYNWRPYMLSELSRTIQHFKGSFGLETALVSMKPRLLSHGTDSSELQLLLTINDQLMQVSEQNNSYFIDTYKLLCVVKSKEDCSNEAGELYRGPNALDLNGLMKLSSNIEAEMGKYFER